MLPDLGGDVGPVARVNPSGCRLGPQEDGASPRGRRPPRRLFCDFPGSIFVRDAVKPERRQRPKTLMAAPPRPRPRPRPRPQVLSRNFSHTKVFRTRIFNVSGNTTEVVSADGTHLTFEGDGGNLFLVGPNGRRNTSLPAIVFTQGRVHAEVSINPVTGVRTNLSFTQTAGGTREDICPLLAE